MDEKFKKEFMCHCLGIAASLARSFDVIATMYSRCRSGGFEFDGYSFIQDCKDFIEDNTK